MTVIVPFGLWHHGHLISLPSIAQGSHEGLWCNHAFRPFASAMILQDHPRSANCDAFVVLATLIIVFRWWYDPPLLLQNSKSCLRCASAIASAATMATARTIVELILLIMICLLLFKGKELWQQPQLSLPLHYSSSVGLQIARTAITSATLFVLFWNLFAFSVSHRVSLRLSFLQNTASVSADDTSSATGAGISYSKRKLI